MNQYTYYKRIGSKIYVRYLDERGNQLKRVVDNFNTLLFTPDKNGLYETINGVKVSPLHIPLELYTREIKRLRNEGTIFGTIPPEVQYMYQNFKIDIENVKLNALNVHYYDIEVYEPRFMPNSGNPVSPIRSISYEEPLTGKTGVIGYRPLSDDADPEVKAAYTLFSDEREMLDWYLKMWRTADILVGQNSRFFDSPYLVARAERLGLDMNSYLPFRKYAWKKVQGKYKTEDVVEILGLPEFDFIELVTTFYKPLPTYKLSYLANEFIGESKVEYTGSIFEFMANDWDEFVRYSLKDTRLLRRINDKVHFVELALTVCYLSMVSPDQYKGKIALWENLLLDECLKRDKKYYDIFMDKTLSTFSMSGLYSESYGPELD